MTKFIGILGVAVSLMWAGEAVAACQTYTVCDRSGCHAITVCDGQSCGNLSGNC